MKTLLSLLAIGITIVFIILNTSSNNNDIENETISHIIHPFISQNKNEVTILFSENIDNDREGVNILTIIALSKKPYIINQGNALTISSKTAMDVIKIDLPDYDLGHSINEMATSYLWHEKEQWAVTVVETTNGFYSRWQRITNIN